MQTLYLLRHAKTERWHPGGEDFDRVLTAKGRDHAARLAAWMPAQLEPPALAISSPSARTRGTLEPLLEAWPELADRVRWEAALYLASSGRLEAITAAAFSDASPLLLVGHNPGFEDFLRNVLRPDLADGIAKFTTGALAVVDFDPDWDHAAGDGRLRHFVTKHDI